MTSSTFSTKRTIAAIMLVLGLWGGYLAVGVTGVFVDRSLFDPRKSVIVVICVGAFVGLWSLVLWRQQARRHDELRPTPTATDRSVALPLPWSASGLASIALSCLGIGFWAFAAFSWQNVAAVTTTMLGWLAAAANLGGATAGIIALSNPSRFRGKWLGMLGLFTLLCSLIVFVVRMKP